MKLSIIVPVFNMAGEGKLNFCMDSLLHQTITDYEIIAVNDASTDNSLNVLRDYEARYPNRVRVITYSENKRQGGAKNEGLKAAYGEWIGFVDSDDWVAPDFYEKLFRKAEETGADVVGCDYSLVTEHTYEIGTIQSNNDMSQTGPLDHEKHGRLILHPGSMVIKIYKHEVIRKNNLRFPEGMFYEDNCAGPLWLMYFKHFEKVEEPLYYYYQHNASTVHHISVEKCEDRMKAMTIFYEECVKRGFLEEYYTEIEYCFSRLFYVNTLFSYMLGVEKPRLSFVRTLREEAMKRFPDFAQNTYYLLEVNGEEQEMIALQCRADWKFFYWYRLKMLVRKYRKKWNI